METQVAEGVLLSLEETFPGFVENDPLQGYRGSPQNLFKVIVNNKSELVN